MNLKKFISWSICSCLFISSTTVHAEIPSPEPDPQELISRISPMRQGDIAPFSGILFSPKATATIVAEFESFDERMKIEVDKAVSDINSKKQFEINEISSKCTTEKTILQADINSKTKQITKLTEDLQIAQNALSNSPSRLVWAGIGVAVGAVTAILITFAVNQASK